MQDTTNFRPDYDRSAAAGSYAANIIDTYGEHRTGQISGGVALDHTAAVAQTAAMFSLRQAFVEDLLGLLDRAEG